MSGIQTRQALGADQLRRIHFGLRNSLRARNFDEPLIDRCAEDAIGKSLIELTEAEGNGKEVPDPVAWVIKVAIWRSIDRLRQEERQAAVPLSDEVAAEIADDAVALPEEAALDNIEAAELHRVVSSLPSDQREALRSYYFLELSTRAGADLLHWSEPTFRRRLRDGMKSLKERFGVPDQGDAVAIEIGLAAALSLSHLHGPLALVLAEHGAAAAESAHNPILHGLRRVRDFLARLQPWGGGRAHPSDPGTVTRVVEAANGPGGALTGKVIGGACAAAICVAAGLFSPDIGVLHLFHNQNKAPAKAKAVPSAPRRETAAPSNPVVMRPPNASSQAAANGEGTAKHGGTDKIAGSHAHRKDAQTVTSSGARERALGDESGTRRQRTHAATEALGIEGAAPAPAEPSSATPQPQSPPQESSPPATASAPAEAEPTPTQKANAALGP